MSEVEWRTMKIWIGVGIIDTAQTLKGTMYFFLKHRQEIRGEKSSNLSIYFTEIIPTALTTKGLPNGKNYLAQDEAR